MLRYGVLGLLIERRGYGYQLVQRLAGRLGAAWHLTPSAVYGALDQLESSGLIRAHEGIGEAAGELPPSERSSRRTARIVYEATPLGVSEFRLWLASPPARASPIRSELQLRIALACPEDIPSLLASIAREEYVVLQRLDDECKTTGLARHLSAKPRPIDGRNGPEVCAEPEDPHAPCEPMGEGSWSNTATALVNAAAAIRLQAELEWIGLVRDTLQRMSVQHHVAVGLVGLPGAEAIQ